MTAPRYRPTDVAHRRDINIFGDLLDTVVREAATQFPQGGSDEDIFQWAKVTSKLLFEMVKRKGHSPDFIMKRAERAVKRWQERAIADDLLGLEAPKLEPPQKEDDNGTTTDDSLR